MSARGQTLVAAFRVRQLPLWVESGHHRIVGSRLQLRSLTRLVAVDVSCEGFCEPLTLVELIRCGLGTLCLS